MFSPMRFRVLRAALVATAVVFVASCVVTGTATTGPGYPAAGLEWNVNRFGGDYRGFDLVTPSPEICQSTCMNEPQCVAFTYVNAGVQGPNAHCWLKNQVPEPAPDPCCVSGTKYAGAPPPAAPAPLPVPPPAPPPPAPPPSAPPPSTWQGTPPTPAQPPPSAPVPPPPAWQGAPATPPQPPPTSPWQGHPTTPPPAAARQWEPTTDRPGMDYKSFDLPDPRPELCRDACWRDGPCRAFTYARPGTQGPNARCFLKSAAPPARQADCCLSGVK